MKAAMRIWKLIVGQEGMLSKQLEKGESLEKFGDDLQRQTDTMRIPCRNHMS